MLWKSTTCNPGDVLLCGIRFSFFSSSWFSSNPCSDVWIQVCRQVAYGYLEFCLKFTSPLGCPIICMATVSLLKHWKSINRQQIWILHYYIDACGSTLALSSFLLLTRLTYTSFTQLHHSHLARYLQHVLCCLQESANFWCSPLWLPQKCKRNPVQGYWSVKKLLFWAWVDRSPL